MNKYIDLSINFTKNINKKKMKIYIFIEKQFKKKF